MLKSTDVNSDYKGSQATNYNFSRVNPATGSLNISIPLLAIKSELPFTLSANYSAGTNGSLGLPVGWGLNIDHINLDSHSITFNNITYLIDPNWQDSSGYQSGLKYLNQHGVKFVDLRASQTLPPSYNDSRSYRYLLTFQNGGHDYFDAAGKLIMKNDRFANHLAFKYKNASL